MKKILLLFFVFSILLDLQAQKKINLSTLNSDQLNLYKEKAVKMRNTGRALTLSGAGVIVSCTVITVIALTANQPEENCHCGPWIGLFYVGLAGAAGMATTIAGIPLWAVGSSRKAKAELTFQKFNIVPENSMALGVGITFRF